MTQKLGLTVIEQDGVTVVGFGDEIVLDTNHVDQISKQLFELIDQKPGRLVVMDMSTVKMISSRTLGVLLKAKQKLDTTGGKMSISGIESRLYRVFKITSLHNIFDFHNDTATAVAELKKEKP